jgi:hypothetical protein
MRRNGRGAVTVQLPGGEAQLAEIVRILDQANLKVDTLQLHQPSLDDVYLAKTGRKLEGSAMAVSPRPRLRRRAGGGGVVAIEAATLPSGSGAVSHGTGLVEQTLAVARRAVVRTVRQRGLLIFPMVFPLILFAINGSALSPATRIPHFPTRHYRDFLIAMTFVQGAMFVSITAGVDLARDIESGFLNRLALIPLRTQALFMGQLAAR